MLAGAGKPGRWCDAPRRMPFKPPVLLPPGGFFIWLDGVCRLGLLVEAPNWLEIARDFLFRQARADQLGWEHPTLQDTVMVVKQAHLSSIDQLALERSQLQGANHVPGLVQGRVVAIE